MRAMKKLLVFALLLAGLAGGTSYAAPEALTMRVAPERDLVFTGGFRDVLVEIELEGRRPEASARAPINLALVLDRSGSMTGAKIEKAKQGACAALDSLDANDYVSMVVYDNKPEILFPPQKIESAHDREILKERIQHVRPGGGTAIYAGLELGAELLRKHLDRERLNRIVLLSDGIANVGPSRTSDLAGLAGRLREDGLSVSTIGLGDDYNEDLMTAIAETSHANYYYVQDAEKLPGIFSDELGCARTVLARGVTIHIRVPEGVRIHEILGHPEIHCGGQTAEISLSEYFGSDKRRFLARCTVEAPHSEALDVASVSLHYDEIATGKSASQSQAARVSFTDDARKSDDSLRSEVAREASIYGNRAAKELAVKLADEGKTKEASEILRSQIVANSSMPVAAQIPNLAAENKNLEATAAEIAQGNLGKASRKQIQYENWQDNNQKR